MISFLPSLQRAIVYSLDNSSRSEQPVSLVGFEPAASFCRPLCYVTVTLAVCEPAASFCRPLSYVTVILAVCQPAASFCRPLCYVTAIMAVFCGPYEKAVRTQRRLPVLSGPTGPGDGQALCWSCRRGIFLYSTESLWHRNGDNFFAKLWK